MSSSDINTENADEALVVVGVKCSPSENPLLRKGVCELFELYFEELKEVGCDLSFQNFASEWENLPGYYSFGTKKGGLFVAVEVPSYSALLEPGKKYLMSDTIIPEIGLFDSLIKNGEQVVGCIAIRPLTDNCGEAKRMYIRKSHRRRGIGNMLAKAMINHAWDCDYNEIKLDSLERLVGAVKLYESLGFERIPAYCECPEDDHVCMNIFRKSFD